MTTFDKSGVRLNRQRWLCATIPVVCLRLLRAAFLAQGNHVTAEWTMSVQFTDRHSCYFGDYAQPIGLRYRGKGRRENVPVVYLIERGSARYGRRRSL